MREVLSVKISIMLELFLDKRTPRFFVVEDFFTYQLI